MGLSFPALNLADLPATDLAAFAAWLTEATAATAAEQARRHEIADRTARAAAYRIAAFPDDPRWTPQPWDGAKIAAGPDTGRRGFIVGRCDDGCEQVDGQPRWRLYGAGGGPIWACLTRAHLRPVPTVRREGTGRAACDYPCLCCITAPRTHLTAHR